MINTNQMYPTFNHEAIAKDFVIFEASRDKGNYYKSKVPDIALQECRALAVAYDRGNTCYILYHRDAVEKHALKQTLESYEEDVRVQEITSQQLVEKRAFLLAQLLCNAIPSLSANGAMYHNVTGKLYYLNPKWFRWRKAELASFWTLEFTFNWEYCVQMRVKTFSNARFKCESRNKPQYLFDSKSFALRRALKDETDITSDRFVIEALYPDRKNTVSFLEFSSLAEFRDCKVGVLHRFLCDVQVYLAPYLTLTMIPLDETSHIGNKHSDDSMLGLRKRVRSVPLYLEDTVLDEQSAALTSLLRKELTQYSGISLTEGTPEKGAALIRIIHNKEYYADTPETDNYAKDPQGCVIQHVTVEDFQLCGISRSCAKEKEDAALHKIIQELAIKIDIFEGRMECYDWPSLGYVSPVTFVLASKSFKDTSEPIHYQRLRVLPDGTLNFDAWDHQPFWTDLEKEKISFAFENRKGNFDFTVKGLIYDDADHIHIIRDTERYTLPDMDALEKILSTTRDDEMLEISPIAEAVKGKLDTLSNDTQTRGVAVLNALQNYGTYASRKDLRSILNLRSKLGQELNLSIFEATDILIGNGIKKQQTRESLFGGTLDIRLFTTEHTQYYYSGYRGKSLKWSLPHACRIRAVTSTGDIPQFESYLPLLEVDFVRANGWTVVPFPFKYLREWSAHYCKEPL